MSVAIARKPIRAKVCKCGCGEKFIPSRQIQPTRDNFDCKVRYAEKVAAKSAAKREKLERAEFKKRKEAAKRPKTLKDEAQKAFNAYIRARDLSAGHSCICCGKPFEPQKFGGSADAGHYLSRGSAPHLRFDERNVHAQRKNCNRPGGTTRAAFREGMIARIGLEAVEALESDQSESRYRDDDYRRIRDEYREKRRALLAQEKVSA